jgi:hypothetical protein
MSGSNTYNEFASPSVSNPVVIGAVRNTRTVPADLDNSQDSVEKNSGRDSNE